MIDALPEQIRADVCQELCVELVLGSIAREEIDARAQRLIRKAFGEAPGPWLVSIDYPRYAAGRPLKEYLRA